MVGVPNKRMHPALTRPRYVSADEAGKFLDDGAEVFLLRLGGTTFVYPELILSVHHVVNETIGGRALAITHCLLADSAIAYATRLSGRVHQLGGLGTMYYGNLVMFDDPTDSHWLQMLGESIDGQLKGERLEVVQPLEKTTWRQAKKLPYLNVLPPQDDVGKYRAFLTEMKSKKLGLDALRTVAEPDPRLPPYTQGLGIRVHGESRFYPLERIQERGLVEEEVGGWSLLILHDPEIGSTRILRRYVDGQTLTFTKSGKVLRDHETRSSWTLGGKAISGRLEGNELERPAYSRAFWFAWSAFFPKTGYHGEN